MGLTGTIVTAVFNGITWGFGLALIALGLTLIFGLLKIVNLAHGSLYMLGAVLALMTINETGSYLLALLVAPLIVGVVGVGIERLVIRPIKEDIPITMVATFGLLLVIQYVVFFMFGPSARSLQAPFDPTIQVAGLTFSGYRVLVSVASVVAILLLYLFLHRTRYGMWMRGVRQDPGMAAAVGIRTSVVYMLTFGLGSYLAALAGVLLAPIVGVHWQMGLDILAVAFIVVIVGGLGSLGGVFVVSHVYAVSENVASVFIQPLEARIFTLALMILIVLYRPEGIKTIIEEFRTS